tara:strand:- start:58 stop:642 length:585 start_codon:yes stop_codon:yes gene_type:complete
MDQEIKINDAILSPDPDMVALCVWLAFKSDQSTTVIVKGQRLEINQGQVWASLSEIATATGLTKGRVYRLINSMQGVDKAQLGGKLLLILTKFVPWLVSKKPRTAVRKDIPENFQKFMDEYPSHRITNKKECLRLWRRIPDDQQDSILLSLRNHKKSEQWVREGGQYVCSSLKFLSDKRYLVSVSAPSNQRPKN